MTTSQCHKSNISRQDMFKNLFSFLKKLSLQNSVARISIICPSNKTNRIKQNPTRFYNPSPNSSSVGLKHRSSNRTQIGLVRGRWDHSQLKWPPQNGAGLDRDSIIMLVLIESFFPVIVRWLGLMAESNIFSLFSFWINCTQIIIYLADKSHVLKSN